MSRRMLFTVIGGIALTLAAGAALLASRSLAHGPGGFHQRMMRHMVSAALDDALAQASVTAEQRAAIYAARDRAFAAVEAARSNRGTHREQALALFEADQLDAAQLTVLHAGGEPERRAMHEAIAQAIVEVHDVLTPEQRKAVANYARTFEPRGRF